MKDEKIEMRNKMFKSEINQNDFSSYSINKQLTLRKRKIQEDIMSKRIPYIEENNNSLEIDINKLNAPEDLKKNYEAILKTSYEVRHYLRQLFGSDLNEKKLALFLLRNFIILQIKELPKEKRKLSRNDIDLLKGLCDLLFDQDIQVRYEVSWCLINISLFPKVEPKLYTEENLNKILNFILHCDDQLINNAISMLRNFSTTDSNKLFFIKNGGLQKAFDILDNDMTNLYLIKHITIFFKNLTTILEKKPHLIGNLILIIPYLKKFIKFFLTNPLKEENEYINILITFDNLSKFQYGAVCNIVMSDNFSKTILEFFKILKNINVRKYTFDIIVNMLSYNESATQLLLNENICQILKQLLYEFKFNHTDFLSEVIFSISNIASGSSSIIELLESEELLLDIIEIAKFYIENYNVNENEHKIIIRECIYTLCNSIIGSNPNIKGKLVTFQNGYIVRILSFGLNCFNFKYENENFLSGIIYSINNCIIFSENIMSDEENYIKRYMIENQIDEHLNKLLNENSISEIDKKNIVSILDSFKDDGIQ